MAFRLKDFFCGRPKREPRRSPAYHHHQTNVDYLKDCPSISDEAAIQLRLRTYPENEEQTTREIYQAAAAIRERAPRDPVGYGVTEIMEVTRASLMGCDRRGKGQDA